MNSSRDWGHSYDYVRAMHLILNNSMPRNWIVATGENIASVAPALIALIYPILAILFTIMVALLLVRRSMFNQSENDISSHT